MKRIEPLSNVKPYWDRHGGYPARVRLAMSNGNIVSYLLEVVQPAPVTDRGWTNIGYNVQDEYQPKHLKKTGCAANTTGK